MMKGKRKVKMQKHAEGRVACRVFWVFITLFMLRGALSVSSFAYSSDSYSIVDEKSRGILEDFIKILPEGMDELSNTEGSAEALGFSSLLALIADTAKGNATEIGEFLMTLIGLSMLSSLASLKDGEMGKACRGAVQIVSSAVILDRVFLLVEEVGESLSIINGFYASLIPVVGAVNAMGLSVNTASAQAIGMTVSLEIYSFLSGGFLYSFVGVLTALAALSSIDPLSFGRIAQSVKKAFLWAVGILTAFVGATFSLQSLVSSYADSGVMRSARYAVSGMIPIVGNSISGALAVLAGGFSYLKGAVGGGAIAAIVTLAISPLVMLLLYRGTFGIAIFFSELCDREATPGVLGAFSFALDALIATYSLTAVIYVVQLTVFLKGGGIFAA